MYDPNVGRWLSEDPIGFEAGDANVYRYVGNFATGAVDPSGLEPVPVDQFKPAVQIATQTFKPDPSNAKRNTAILEGVVAAAKAAGLKNVSGVLNTRETAFMGRIPGLVISVRGVDCEGNKFHITVGLRTGTLRITVQEKIQPLQAGVGAGALRLLPRLLQLFGQGAKNPYLVQSVALSAALAGVGGALITELIEFLESAEIAATSGACAITAAELELLRQRQSELEKAIEELEGKIEEIERASLEQIKNRGIGEGYDPSKSYNNLSQLYKELAELVRQIAQAGG